MKFLWLLTLLFLSSTALPETSLDTIMIQPVELIPFSEEAFISFYKEFIPEYADVMYQARMFEDKQEANIAASTRMSILFPEGLKTKGQYLFKIQYDKEEVGDLWYTTKKNPTNTENIAWLCYIYVKPPFRNMGYAKASIINMEMHLRSLGVTRIGMNVFSTSPFSKKLYESLGYSVVNTILTPDQRQVIRYELSKDL